MPRGNDKHTFAVAKRLADNLKRLRESGGLTADSVAKAAGISAITVRKIESCQRWPSPDVLERIAVALDVTPAELIS